MLDAKAKLRVMNSSMDCDVYSYTDRGRTVKELLKPGMFDMPAGKGRAGILPSYDRPALIYVFASDGPAIFCSIGVERNPKGEAHTLRFSAIVPSIAAEKEADIELPLKRRAVA